MGVREVEPADPDGIDFPFALGPPNRGRHRDPAPIADGFGRAVQRMPVRWIMRAGQNRRPWLA